VGAELSSERDILALVADDAGMMAALTAVAGLGLPDCWIGAGFLRAAVWDRLHGYAERTTLDDIDVIYFDPEAPDPAAEVALEQRLAGRLPGLPWSVKNQARMHARNGDAPYGSSAEALAGGLELLAPLGTRDLLDLTVRPTPHARAHKDRLAAYRARMEHKNWPAIWPKLRVVWG
jgi:hypothetical protein